MTTHTHETACGTCGWQATHPDEEAAHDAATDHHVTIGCNFFEIHVGPAPRLAEEVLAESIRANLGAVTELLNRATSGEQLTTREFEALLALREGTSIAADSQAAVTGSPRVLTAWESGEPTRSGR